MRWILFLLLIVGALMALEESDERVRQQRNQHQYDTYIISTRR
jgi:hypothetical protein